VTFVHGTFAKGSRWPALAQVVQDTLPRPVACEYFDWSGGLSVSARHHASLELREVLQARLDRYPQADHYAIAHSHGGNVLLGALVPGPSTRFKLVICLSTPFLAAYPRSSLAPLFVAALGLLMWSLIALRDRLTLVLWIAPLGLLGLLAVLLELRLRATRIERTMSLDLPKGLPLVILRSAADEAALLLAAAQGVNGLLRRLVDLMVAMPSVARRLWRSTWRGLGTIIWVMEGGPESPLEVSGISLLVVPMSVAALGVVTWLAFAYDWPWLLRLIASCFLGLATMPIWAALLVVAAFVLASLMVAPVILLLPLALFIVGGGELVLAGLFLNVAIEPTPAGTWTVRQLPWPPREGLLALRHSASYQDPLALEQIRRWLRQSVEQYRGR
jgi:hypothetical protein